MERIPRSQAVENLVYFKARLDGSAKSHKEIEGRNGPIIGIHGVFGGWTDKSVKKYFLDNNIKASLPDFGNYLNGIDYYLPQIDSLIQKNPNATLLGFSAGGLSLLRYAYKYGWNNFRKIITVGSPFDGVILPRPLKLMGQTFTDLEPGSKILQEIKNIIAPDNKVLSVFGRGDMFTPNPDMIVLNWPSIVLNAKSHGDLQNNFHWLKEILDIELGHQE